MSSEVTRTCAGSPSRMATRDGPWDSPAVSQRSMSAILSAVERGDDRLSNHDTDQGSDEHERPERVVPPLGDQGEQPTEDPAEDQAGPDAHPELGPAQPAQSQTEHPGEPDVAVPEAARVDEPEHEEHAAVDQPA